MKWACAITNSVEVEVEAEAAVVAAPVRRGPAVVVAGRRGPVAVALRWVPGVRPPREAGEPHPGEVVLWPPPRRCGWPDLAEVVRLLRFRPSAHACEPR